MTREWLFHNKGLFNWWFEDKWGEAVRTGLKDRLRYTGWVSNFMGTHKPKENQLGINRVTPLGKGTTPNPFGTLWDSGDAVKENKFIKQYIEWFLENVSISPARKTGKYNQASSFDAPIYEITVSLDYAYGAWAKMFGGSAYRWALEVPLEWIFKTNLDALQNPPLTGETLVEEMEYASTTSVRSSWPLGSEQPFIPNTYLTMAVVGRGKDIAYFVSDIQESLPEDGLEGRSKKEWVLTFTPLTYRPARKTKAWDDFLFKSEVKP
jgi:hypothetical protein